LRFASNSGQLSPSSKFIPKYPRKFIAAEKQFTISVRRSNDAPQRGLFLLLSPAGFACVAGRPNLKEPPQRSREEWTSTGFIQNEWPISSD
jgi:hypothetical protein